MTPANKLCLWVSMISLAYFWSSFCRGEESDLGDGPPKWHSDMKAVAAFVDWGYRYQYAIRNDLNLEEKERKEVLISAYKKIDFQGNPASQKTLNILDNFFISPNGITIQDVFLKIKADPAIESAWTIQSLLGFKSIVSGVFFKKNREILVREKDTAFPQNIVSVNSFMIKPYDDKDLYSESSTFYSESKDTLFVEEGYVQQSQVVVKTLQSMMTPSLSLDALSEKIDDWDDKVKVNLLFDQMAKVSFSLLKADLDKAIAPLDRYIVYKAGLSKFFSSSENALPAELYSFLLKSTSIAGAGVVCREHLESLKFIEETSFPRFATGELLRSACREKSGENFHLLSCYQAACVRALFPKINAQLQRSGGNVLKAIVESDDDTLREIARAVIRVYLGGLFFKDREYISKLKKLSVQELERVCNPIQSFSNGNAYGFILAAKIKRLLNKFDEGNMVLEYGAEKMVLNLDKAFLLHQRALLAQEDGEIEQYRAFVDLALTKDPTLMPAIKSKISLIESDQGSAAALHYLEQAKVRLSKEEVHDLDEVENGLRLRLPP